MIIETRFFPFNGGITISESLIIVKAGHKTEALVAHEMCHQKQMSELGAFGFVKFWFKYLTSKDFKKKVEVEAYKVSIANGQSIESCAKHLSGPLYKLGITYQQALDLLKA
jgi:hypothetical protein